MFKKLVQKLNCWTGGHDWTSAVQEGIPATQEQLESGLNGFFEYAELYCKHCGKRSKLDRKDLYDD